jgi:rubrerythrin
VSAYDGAIYSITSDDYQQTAATIATIEARHSAFFNKLLADNNGTPPSAPTDGSAPAGSQAGVSYPTGTFDAAKMPSDVAAAVSSLGFVVCPSGYPLTLPQVRPAGVNSPSTFDKATTSNANPASGAAYSQEAFNNDLTALNYALFLENLEAAFYAYAQKNIPSSAFTSAFGSNGASYSNNLGLIAAHESAHAQFLTAVITARGGSPYPACTYNFGAVTTPAQYLATAVTLESTGVMAYDGAVNAITDTNLQQAAATIATVEARHTAYLNLVAKQTNTAVTAPYTVANPFPNNGQDALDTPMEPSAIASAVTGTGFVTSCSFGSPALPSRSDKLSAAPSSGVSGAALLVVCLGTWVAMVRW